MVRFPMLIHRKKTGLMVSLESVVLVCVAWQIMILQELSCIWAKQRKKIIRKLLML